MLNTIYIILSFISDYPGLFILLGGIIIYFIIFILLLLYSGIKSNISNTKFKKKRKKEIEEEKLHKEYVEKYICNDHQHIFSLKFLNDDIEQFKKNGENVDDKMKFETKKYVVEFLIRRNMSIDNITEAEYEIKNYQHKHKICILRLKK